MGFTQTVMFVFVVVAATPIAFTQESTEPARTDGPSNSPPSGASPGFGSFGNFPFNPPKFDMQALWPHFAAAGFSPRHRRALDEDSEIRAKRSVIYCNFLNQGGFRCTGCRTVRRCYPFNMGTLTTCGGLFPYCNNGRCSSVKGSLCSSTTSTTSSTTSTSSSSSTSSTTPSSTTGATNSTG